MFIDVARRHYLEHCTSYKRLINFMSKFNHRAFWILALTRRYTFPSQRRYSLKRLWNNIATHVRFARRCPKQQFD